MTEKTETQPDRKVWGFFEETDFFCIQTTKLDTLESFLSSEGTKEFFVSKLDGYDLAVVVKGPNGILVYETRCSILGKEGKLKLLQLCLDHPKSMPLYKRTSIYKALRGYFGTTLDN